MRLFLFIFALFSLLTFTLSGQAVAQHTQIPYTPWNNVKPSDPPPLPDYVREQEAEQITTAKPLLQAKPSKIEELYAQRIIDPLEQFGYDIFEDAPSIKNTAPMGAVQDDFVLGTGDELLITFSGQRRDSKAYTIDSSGVITIEDLPPLPAIGLSIGEFRANLQRALRDLHNTQAYVSLTKARQIGVLVVGNVKHPGRKTLNVFNSVLDALNQAGGIRKDGSLRQIKLIRDGRSMHVDLYMLLMHGAPHVDLQLKDGDRLVIPPIGPTIGVSGAVKRPGIYELRKTAFGLSAHTKTTGEKLSLNEVLDFSGGVLVPGANRFLMLSLETNGEESVTQIDNFQTKQFESGSILSVLKSDEKKSGTIELSGHTRRPGLYDLTRYKTLSDILDQDAVMGDDIYPLLGIIKRWDKDKFSAQIISFPIRSVFKNEFDLSLQSNDTIILLSNDDISDIYDKSNEKEYTVKTIDQGSTNNKVSDTIDEDLKIFLKEHEIHLRGAVRKPGSYPIADGVTLETVLASAGGLTLDANIENIEITSRNLGSGYQDHGRSGTQRSTIDLNSELASQIALSPGDTIRVNQKFRKTGEKTVLIVGEVLHPGEYDIIAGDKVSDLIERAGGMTEQAYPPGTIYSRESERRAEELRFRAAARDMEQRLAASIESDENAPDSTQIKMVRELAQELENIEAVGRITVETDPTILKTKPELDMYLEKGDRIYVPKRPLSVRVSGEVLSPASLQFRKDKGPLDYIHEAGGFTYHADKSRSFVLYPDGSAQPLRVSSWNHTPVFIPPGSTIIVPRDPKPFDFMESAKDVGQILSNLAITSVFIDDIRD